MPIMMAFANIVLRALHSFTLSTVQTDATLANTFPGLPSLSPETLCRADNIYHSPSSLVSPQNFTFCDPSSIQYSESNSGLNNVLEVPMMLYDAHQSFALHHMEDRSARMEGENEVMINRGVSNSSMNIFRPDL